MTHRPVKSRNPGAAPGKLGPVGGLAKIDWGARMVARCLSGLLSVFACWWALIYWSQRAAGRQRGDKLKRLQKMSN